MHQVPKWTTTFGYLSRADEVRQHARCHGCSAVHRRSVQERPDRRPAAVPDWRGMERQQSLSLLCVVVATPTVVAACREGIRKMLQRVPLADFRISDRSTDVAHRQPDSDAQHQLFRFEHPGSVGVTQAGIQARELDGHLNSRNGRFRIGSKSRVRTVEDCRNHLRRKTGQALPDPQPTRPRWMDGAMVGQVCRVDARGTRADQ